MKIVADENIPYVDALFGELGEIVTRPGRDICAADVADADVLLVRSVTSVNQRLLGDSNVKFVGTCTIGTDHLDKNWLDSAGIEYRSAPGCNAYGVVQYVFSVLANLDLLRGQPKVGVIGCGNVGGRLYRTLKALGLDVVVYDPFLSKSNIPDLQEWEALYDCDIVCTHTPLTTSGPHPTEKMITTNFFSNLKTGCLLLNAGRGGVIDNNALSDYLDGDNLNNVRVVLDVWESEPDVHRKLLHQVIFASPHIAGYSFEGKTNGSLMIFTALAEFVGLDESRHAEIFNRVKTTAYGEPELIDVVSVEDAILQSYQVSEDHARMLAVEPGLPASFDQLRKNYPMRREFSHYRVNAASSAVAEQCAAIGFLV